MSPNCRGTALVCPPGLLKGQRHILPTKKVALPWDMAHRLSDSKAPRATDVSARNTVLLLPGSWLSLGSPDSSLHLRQPAFRLQLRPSPHCPTNSQPWGRTRFRPKQKGSSQEPRNNQGWKMPLEFPVFLLSEEGILHSPLPSQATAST